MEEAAVSSPETALTVDSYLERLRALQTAIVSDLDIQVSLVEKTLRAKGGGEILVAAAAAGGVSIPSVRPEDVAVLDALDETRTQFSKSVKVQLGKVVRRHFEIDVGFLNEIGIGEMIREFRPVSAETTQLALADFLNGVSNGDDFRLCLKAGADVDGLVEGQTALIRAVCADNREAAEMIMSDGADLEAQAGEALGGVEGVVAGDTALVVGCRQRRWGLIRSLVAEGANVDAMGVDTDSEASDAVSESISEGPEEGSGSKIRCKKALQIACEAAEKDLDSQEENGGSDPSFGLRLRYDPQKEDPAVRSAVSEALKNLLMKTSDAADLKISARESCEKESLVHFFSWHEFEELLLLSLSRGCKIDAFDGVGWTALMNAAARFRPHNVQFLIDNGADVNMQAADGEDFAFTVAVPRTNYSTYLSNRREIHVLSVQKVLGILLEHGANMNSRGFLGQTALHRAVEGGALELVRFLVKAGADLQVRDVNERTPHDLAEIRSRPSEIVTILVPPPIVRQL
uniref:Uncharacterized protein n=1 Tax=Chromera velia CCMP2878 TaxID=1169474 RepID=A0A0G4IEJ5_9ALVE|eukprot:Cvel_13723.t1-p1 / transcript=Cvel_13723.t1 / gene=Cvel_13723 / organism=Chromera_velia_CCMP2878 / gene_product=Putative ankyrin repeat protein MM_0045, putative / transcript_product=Putative ankyrin repeat protein MM_0045, putative / location=Cvel_scaffold949:13513-15057(+) / protein_length=515 / sequence_SO=supercontig / SO=protein_coding / is_pseudo=false